VDRQKRRQSNAATATSGSRDLLGAADPDDALGEPTFDLAQRKDGRGIRPPAQR
jgi:hypothetical protein